MAGSAVFIGLGFLTVLISNQFFIRMTPIEYYDYIFLFFTAALSGAYIGLKYYSKKTLRKCNTAAAAGFFGGLLSFGCAICNKLLIILLGLTGVVTYFMPIQPVLGILSVILLAYAVYMQASVMRKGDKI